MSDTDRNPWGDINDTGPARVHRPCWKIDLLKLPGFFRWIGKKMRGRNSARDRGDTIPNQTAESGSVPTVSDPTP